MGRGRDSIRGCVLRHANQIFTFSVILPVDKDAVKHGKLSSVLCDDLDGWDGGGGWEGGPRGRGYVYAYS